MPKILIVEDDLQVAVSVKDWLLFEKYLVEHVTTGSQALEMIKAYDYDLVILDINLPMLSGLEVCRRYRDGGGACPILMLTGQDAVDDRANGLDAGADDYLTKPFHLKELSARVRALLRRPGEIVSSVLRAGNLVLDSTKHSLTIDGEQVHLPRMEFALLEFLMRHQDQIFNASTLLERVWTADSEKSPETIRTTIKKLRNKIDTDGVPSLIQNVHGVGYKLSEQ
ncbi:MAG: response regulator transcription factor [Candidatus Obscuribacterales bacterium]|jgi:DNA-binding response OmpR family regulator